MLGISSRVNLTNLYGLIVIFSHIRLNSYTSTKETGKIIAHAHDYSLVDGKWNDNCICTIVVC